MTISALKQSLTALAIMLFSISCSKDESTDQKPPEVTLSGKGKVSYFAKASGSATSGIVKTLETPASSSYVKWSSASIFIEKIAFVGKNGSVIDTTITVNKNLNILNSDVLTGVFNLPAGSYKDVKVKLFLKKAGFPELAFNLKGTFVNKTGGTDSIMLASSMPFEANLGVNDFTITASDNYKVVFNYNLDKVLAGISSTKLQEEARSHLSGGKKMYSIWKGGSQDEPLYNEVSANWQTVATAVISKE
ncbi:hypothetical protein [Desertivirga brevis]|uniref:hypothetical protein n=1 Tax=Desertivirga brevis TaxID=2810310 RepID=UPI001F606710|nr:hypothetical protein [Pedobacter sp. SYSU D00873]